VRKRKREVGEGSAAPARDNRNQKKKGPTRREGRQHEGCLGVTFALAVEGQCKGVTQAATLTGKKGNVLLKRNAEGKKNESNFQGRPWGRIGGSSSMSHAQQERAGDAENYEKKGNT